MNIFQIKTKPHDKERLNDFIQGGFIAIGWPGIGDLFDVTKDEVRERLDEAYTYSNSRSLGNDLGNVWAFSKTMGEGDIVLFQGHLDDVYIVKVGPYEYVKHYDNQEGMAHQRKFELLRIVKRQSLNSKVQELLRNRSAVTKFKYPLEEAGLDFLDLDLPFTADNKSKVEVDNNKLKEALEIIYAELNSDIPERRFNAAIELLRFAK